MFTVRLQTDEDRSLHACNCLAVYRAPGGVDAVMIEKENPFLEKVKIHYQGEFYGTETIC